MKNEFIVDAKPTQSTREVLPAGSYMATLYGIVDLGTQYSPMFDNRQRKIRLSWELPTELRVFKEEKGEQPIAIHKEYTLSFGEKSNLRKDIRSRRGREMNQQEIDGGFNLGAMIGESCLLSIGIKDGKETQYNIINGISPLVKGMDKPVAINKPLIYKTTEGTESEVFKSLPEFLQKKIFDSKEFKPVIEPEEATDMPF